MPKPPIAAKNLQGLSELMLLEELAYKKYSTYAASFKDTQLKTMCATHAANHKDRFQTLLDYLNTHE